MLILWNKDKTLFFNITANDMDTYCTSVKGFGVNFNISKHESLNNTKITNIKNNAPNIEFEFIAKSFGRFRELIDFISANGLNKLIIEYRDRLYDVYAKTLPKSQFTQYQALEEKFIFERIGYAYIEKELTFVIDANVIGTVDIPLNVPHKLVGQAFINEVEFTNSFFAPMTPSVL